jgi:hydrogenase maturation protease
LRYLVGAGTFAASDDGVGLRVVEGIAQAGQDEARGVRAVSLPGGWADLPIVLGGDAERVLVVDCARMGLAPGEYRFFRARDVESVKALRGVSTHGGDLLQALSLAEAVGQPLPELEFMGIEPENVEPGIELSPRVAARLDEYAAAALDHLAG